MDTQNFLSVVKVHAANIVEFMGARLLLQELVGRSPRLNCLFADRGYTGPPLDWITTLLGWDTEIVSKPENDPQQEWVLVDGIPVQRGKLKGGFQVQRQ